MPDQPYSNRELDGKFNTILTELRDIKQQTTKHNGRMTSIERKQYMFLGALSVVMVVVVPIAGWVLHQVVNNGV